MEINLQLCPTGAAHSAQLSTGPAQLPSGPALLPSGPAQLPSAPVRSSYFPQTKPSNTYTAATNTPPIVMSTAPGGQAALQDRSNSVSSQVAVSSGQPAAAVKRKPLPAWLMDDKAKADYMKKKMKTNSLFK